MYAEHDLLMLSGIQHVAFCERQWALIHIEQQWNENVLTVEGHHLHERVDDPLLVSSVKGSVVLRSLSIVSRELGLHGMADAVEFNQTGNPSNAIALPGKQGYWQPVPVEYKRGRPKPDERDEVQLCAQAMCLEEMNQIHIPAGYLYYGETRHRHEVVFNPALREKVSAYAVRMHDMFRNGTTPPAVQKTHCKSCSLQNLCLPGLSRAVSVKKYLDNALAGD